MLRRLSKMMMLCVLLSVLLPVSAADWEYTLVRRLFGGVGLPYSRQDLTRWRAGLYETEDVGGAAGGAEATGGELALEAEPSLDNSISSQKIFVYFSDDEGSAVRQSLADDAFWEAFSCPAVRCRWAVRFGRRVVVASGYPQFVFSFPLPAAPADSATIADEASSCCNFVTLFLESYAYLQRQRGLGGEMFPALLPLPR